MWRWIGRSLIAIFAVIGLLSVLTAVGLVWQLGRIVEAPPQAVPETIVLTLDLRQPLAESPPDSAFSPFEPSPLTVREVVDAIDRARGDERVAALRADFGGDAQSLATAQEIRRAVERFRDAGKPTLAYADSYGELGGTSSYYLASAFDEIWLRPIGSVGITGILFEVPFANTLLTDLGIQPEFARQGAYKSSPEVFTESDFTAPHREMMESLADSLYEQVVAGIADGRGLGQDTVAALIDRAPLLAEEAEAAGLVDRLANDHALDQSIEERFGASAGELGVRAYLQNSEPPAGTARVALVYGVGTIVLADGNVPFGGRMMSGYAVAEAIDEAAADDGIAAIVLRIDSGGGSAVASAVIGDAVRRAVDAGTPVVASMSTVAGSGGYWIAAPAVAIVAQPATLTGSIGVFTGTFNSADLWDDIGVSWGTVQRGDNADLWSVVGGFSEGGRERIDRSVESIYDRFIAVVADGRGLDPAAVHEVAQGRVWTGAQALERGLVDRLGGLDEALVAVRERLDLAEDSPLDVVIRPEPPSPLEELRDLLSGMPSGDAALVAAVDRAVDRMDPRLRRLLAMLPGSGERLLQMPPLVAAP